MQKKQAPERFSASNLANQRAQGKSRTNLAKVKAKTESELESDIANDPDFNNEPPNWHTKAEAIMPPPKTSLSIRLDNDVLIWFKQQGPGYQTKINAVLKTFVQHATKQNQ